LPDTGISEVLSIQSRGSVDRIAAKEVNLKVECVRRDLQVGDPIPTPKLPPSDPRSLRKDDVTDLVEQVISLSEAQRKGLYAILIKYLDYLTTKPKKCK
jgi:hypothetical protein